MRLGGSQGDEGRLRGRIRGVYRFRIQHMCFELRLVSVGELRHYRGSCLSVCCIWAWSECSAAWSCWAAVGRPRTRRSWCCGMRWWCCAARWPGPRPGWADALILGQGSPPIRADGQEKSSPGRRTGRAWARCRRPGMAADAGPAAGGSVACRGLAFRPVLDVSVKSVQRFAPNRGG
jgi:hypothetical protein